MICTEGASSQSDRTVDQRFTPNYIFMKLRIHKNSIRLRLSIADVDEIAKGNPVHEHLEFGEGSANCFDYSLVPEEGIAGIRVIYSPGRLIVSLPKSMADNWATTDLVGLQNDPDGKVSVLIEKDFQCLQKRPGEDESKYFPNPL